MLGNKNQTTPDTNDGLTFSYKNESLLEQKVKVEVGESILSDMHYKISFNPNTVSNYKKDIYLAVQYIDQEISKQIGGPNYILLLSTDNIQMLPINKTKSDDPWENKMSLWQNLHQNNLCLDNLHIDKNFNLLEFANKFNLDITIQKAQLHSEEEKCLFCKNSSIGLQGYLKNQLQEEKSDTFGALINTVPTIKHSLLLIPNRKIKEISELNADELFDFIKAFETYQKLWQQEGKGVFSIIQNTEKSGQTIHHLHMHIAPRDQLELGNIKERIMLRKNKQSPFMLLEYEVQDKYNELRANLKQKVKFAM